MAAKKLPKRDAEQLLADVDEWDEGDDDSPIANGSAGNTTYQLNVQARRLYDRYQDERRLREILRDDFEFLDG
jgi:hypothetical protein